MTTLHNPLNVLLARTSLVRVLSLLCVALIIGCGSSTSDPAETTDPPPSFQVSGGTFDVTEQIIFNACNSSATFSGTYEIQIQDLSFSMGDKWKNGTWDPTTKRGMGQSARKSETFRVCTITTWSNVIVTFHSKDEFTGSITFRQSVDGECATSCTTTWQITGIRQQN